MLESMRDVRIPDLCNRPVDAIPQQLHYLTAEGAIIKSANTPYRMLLHGRWIGRIC
jgi:hypothetical protein